MAKESLPTSKKSRNNGIGCSPEERFWSRVDKTPGLGPQGECWEWVASCYPNGYGQVSWEGIRKATHLVSWKLAHGSYPVLCALHSCDNRKCVNPDHLHEGTKKENSAEMVLRGRSLQGENQPFARLTTEDILAIYQKRRLGHTQKVIANEFGLNQKTVSDILRGRRWGHIYADLTASGKE